MEPRGPGLCCVHACIHTHTHTHTQAHNTHIPKYIGTHRTKTTHTNTRTKNTYTNTTLHEMKALAIDNDVYGIACTATG